MDLVERAGQLKPMLVEFALSPRFNREFSAVIARRSPIRPGRGFKAGRPRLAALAQAGKPPTLRQVAAHMPRDSL